MPGDYLTFSQWFIRKVKSGHTSLIHEFIANLYFNYLLSDELRIRQNIIATRIKMKPMLIQAFLEEIPAIKRDEKESVMMAGGRLDCQIK